VPVRAREGTGERPLACVLGNTDLIRPLGLAGVRCATPGRPDSPKAYSKFVDVLLGWADNWGPPGPLLDLLLEFADTQPEPPVLFFQHDGDLMFVSRNREALATRFRFTIADADVVERSVDKTRFADLARERGLPVPATAVLHPADEPEAPDELPIPYPVVLKPRTRRDVVWRPLAGHAKALRVDHPRQLAELWPSLASARVDLVAQELIEGAEDRIESYHVYVDERGEPAGEFTGRKVRTWPPVYGETTALEITDEADVRELGRDCTSALGLRGVAKLDFKRGPDGTLHLLEVNPRFNLWHLPGAVAGVNLPALVYADLAGQPRPPAGPLRPGVRWSLPWRDLPAARGAGMPLHSWLAWQARCETRHVAALDDPLPFLRGLAWRHARRRLRRAGP
jgi:predicted ATP-grasp superfamily ATP-dependent carboligase